MLDHETIIKDDQAGCNMRHVQDEHSRLGVLHYPKAKMNLLVNFRIFSFSFVTNRPS